VSSGHKASINRLRIIVLDSIVRLPMGGMAWHHLQYPMGLAALGHDVYSFGDSNDYPWSCYDPVRHVTDTNPSYGLGFAARTFERVELGDRWAYYDAHTKAWLGPCRRRAEELCASADLLINLGNSNPFRSWHGGIPVRVLVDTDPAFTQIRNLTDSALRTRALQHTAFFCFGENVASGRSSVPDDGLPWQPTRQPVVLDAWPLTPGPVGARFSTVMQWDSYPVREYQGCRYGMKSDSFEKYSELPAKAGPVFELALGNAHAPRASLRDKGWVIRDPTELSRHPWTYQEYIQASKGEFTVAKQGYVISRSGWFSERSAVYLASGRPVITEETGFSDWLPTGTGIFSFRDADEVLSAIEQIDKAYEFHCRAARDIAEEFFDSRRVLTRLIEASFGQQPHGEDVAHSGRSQSSQ
jgi:hypothetical protein